MTYRVSKEELFSDAEIDAAAFPKYTTQLLNIANQNSKATSPKNVGQLTEMIQDKSITSYEDWVEFHKKEKPGVIEEASLKISTMIDNFKEAINLIDNEMITTWVEDLVYDKTYIGLKCQESILKKIAEEKGVAYKLADPEDEAKGIDGYVGDTALSIKPETYKTKMALPEEINVTIVYYEKVKNGIKFEYEN